MRDRFAGALHKWAVEYGEPDWFAAAEHFAASGERIGRLTDVVVDVLLGSTIALEAAPALVREIADEEERGFMLLSAA